MELTDKRTVTQCLSKRCPLSKRSKCSSRFGRDRYTSDGSLKFFTSIQELAERVVEREIYLKAKRDNCYPVSGYASTTSTDTYQDDDGCIDAFIKQELTIRNTVIQHRPPARIPPHIVNMAVTERPNKQEEDQTAQLNILKSIATDDNAHIPYDKDKHFMSKHCNTKQSASSTLKAYSCNMCDLSFGKKHDLNKHRSIHTGEKPYTCNVCSAKFAVVYSLKIHKRVHNGEKPFYCSMCDAKFMTKSNLRTHMSRHRDDRPFSCDVCDATFKTARVLRAHALVHTGRKPYNCDICNVDFILSNSLKEHKRIHSRERPFGCSLCEAMFTKASYLKQHVKRKHGDEKRLC